MVVNIGKLEDMVVQVKEKVEKVERLNLGEGSG